MDPRPEKKEEDTEDHCHCRSSSASTDSQGRDTAPPFLSLSELWASPVNVKGGGCCRCSGFFLTFNFCPALPALLQLGVADYAKMRQTKLLKDKE